MPKLILLGTTVFVLALGIRDANAMAGSADLSPDQSPYAILEPITLGPAAIAPESTETLPTVPVRHSARHHRRSAQRQKPK
jgi:hypothetical protein